VSEFDCLLWPTHNKVTRHFRNGTSELQIDEAQCKRYGIPECAKY